MTAEQERQFFDRAWRHVRFRGKDQYRFDAGPNLTLLIEPGAGDRAHTRNRAQGQVMTGPNHKIVIRLTAMETETVPCFALRLIQQAEAYLSEQRQFYNILVSDLEDTLQRHGVKPSPSKTY